jgi:hypothetical protein
VEPYSVVRPYSNQAVVSRRLGSTVAVSVAEENAIDVAAVVDARGGANS